MTPMHFLSRKQKKKKKEEENTKEQESTELPEVSKERFFEVETSLKDVFGGDKDTAFSFSSLFGGGAAEKEDSSDEEDMQTGGNDTVIA